MSSMQSIDELNNARILIVHITLSWRQYDHVMKLFTFLM